MMVISNRLFILAVLPVLTTIVAVNAAVDNYLSPPGNGTVLQLDGLISMADIKAGIKYTGSNLESIWYSKTTDRAKRQVIAGQRYKWNGNQIPYQIWGGNARTQNLVRRGVSMWEQETCLRFQENARSRDGIRYTLENGDACFTEYIGKNGGLQEIVIGSECGEEYVIAHETGHALGFWHTHQRPDREHFVRINWRNVRDEATASFMPYQSMMRAFGVQGASNLVVPYDYGSLMHYHAVAHAKRVSDFTLVPRELKYVTTMGTEKMSFLDAKVINDLYCSHMCGRFQQLRCHGGGYQDPNDCNRCRCPEGLGGQLCDRLQPSACGRELTATGSWQTLRSPNGNNVNCYWRITSLQAPRGRVRFRLTDGEFPCSYGCQSYVEIKHKRDLRLTGFRSCCYRPKEDTVSEGNEVYVIYHPNGRNAHFTLQYVKG